MITSLEKKPEWGPLEIQKGFWFTYKDRTYVFIRENDLGVPIFEELLKKGENMAIDNEGNWVGHTIKTELSDLEFEYFKVAKDLLMNMKITLEDFKSIKLFIEKLDIENMTLLEAVIFNILTGKSFVKNSWSDEAKSRLQTFIYDRKLITQDGNEVSTKSGSVKIESSERYSLYRGEYISLIDSNNEKVQRMRCLEEEIMPFYNKIKEYEELKRELNL